MKALSLSIFKVSSLCIHLVLMEFLAACLDCAEALCKPLLKLFTLSLESSQIPNMWKESFVLPLHKKGTKVKACKFRGISNLSAIPKLFENIIVGQLYLLTF